ncbi:hypothetical protein CHUAL_011105 [Chamberlinius hualienensis]
MDLNGFFRNFWGRSGPHNANDEMGNGDDTGRLNDPYHSLNAEFNEIFTHLENQLFGHFKSFFSDINEFREDFENIPSLQPLPETSLRDKFLKKPDSELPGSNASEVIYSVPEGLWRRPPPVELKDQNLDSGVADDGIKKTLRDNPSFFGEIKPCYKSAMSSFFSANVDGKVEQRYTKKDSFGNEETVVKRQVGNKSHSVVTRKDAQGVEEHEEIFENIDDKNVEDFNRQWSKVEPKDLPSLLHGNDEFQSSDSSATGLYQRLFGKFLPKK